MVGTSRDVAKLREELDTYQEALREIASHVGLPISDGVPPIVMAKAICSRIKATNPIMGFARTNPGSEIRIVPHSVKTINVAGAIDLVVHQGDVTSMEVFARDKRDLRKVKTLVTDESLTLDILDEPKDLMGSSGVSHGSRNQSLLRVGSNDIRVEITLPNLRYLEVHGPSAVRYRGIELGELSVDIVGSGSIDLQGVVSELHAKVSGAGVVQAVGLSARRASLTLSGQGDLRATVMDDVRARLSGVGNIDILGQPPRRDTRVTGVGAIRYIEGSSSQ